MDDRQAQQTAQLRSAESGRILKGQALLDRKVSLRLQIRALGGYKAAAAEIGWPQCFRIAKLLGEPNHPEVRAQRELMESEQRRLDAQASRLELSRATDPRHDERVMAVITRGGTDVELSQVLAEVTVEYAERAREAAAKVSAPTFADAARPPVPQRSVGVPWESFPDHQRPDSPR